MLVVALNRRQSEWACPWKEETESGAAHATEISAVRMFNSAGRVECGEASVPARRSEHGCSV